MRRVEAPPLDRIAARHHRGAVGLEQAIPASPAPPLPYCARTSTRWWTGCAPHAAPRGLQHLADEINDASPTSSSPRSSSRALRDRDCAILGALAKSAREEVDMAAAVWPSAPRPRRSVQIVVAVSIASSSPVHLQPRLRRAVRHRRRTGRTGLRLRPVRARLLVAAQLSTMRRRKVPGAGRVVGAFVRPRTRFLGMKAVRR